METGNLVVSWVLQLKEIIAICGLLWLIWFTYAKHIPFILMRDQNRAEKEAERRDLSHQRDQERWAMGLDKMTGVVERLDNTMHGVVERLDNTMHTMVARLEDFVRQPKSRS